MELSEDLWDFQTCRRAMKKDKQIFYDTRGVKSINDKAAKAKQAHKRIVPGFSTQSRQNNVQVTLSLGSLFLLIMSKNFPRHSWVFCR